MRKANVLFGVVAAAVMAGLGAGRTPAANAPDRPAGLAPGRKEFSALPGRPVGFRGDGTGVFPGDCEPVTEWSETQGIVWKTPLPNWGNGGMFVVNGRIFLVCEPGLTNVGPQLLCVDADTGKVLWNRDVHHLGLLAKEESERVKKEWLAERRREAVRTRLLGPLREAAKDLYERRGFDDLVARFREENERDRKTIEARKNNPEDSKVRQAKERIAGRQKRTAYLEAKSLADVEARWRHLDERLTAAGFRSGEPERITRAADLSGLARNAQDVEKRRGRLQKYGLYWNNWYRNGHYVGTGFPTPVSDGEYVYLVTGHNNAACYDMEGHRRWVNWFGPQGPCWGSYVISPVLVGEVLVVPGGKHMNVQILRGLDKRTGEKLWEFEYTKIAYPCGTPLPLRLPLPGAGGETLDVVFTAWGDVVRVSDGKILAGDIGWCTAAASCVADGDVVFVNNGQAGGGYHGEPRGAEKGTMIAVQLAPASRDSVTPKIRWTAKGLGSEERSPVYHNGLVYNGPRVLDAATGQVLGEVPRGGRWIKVDGQNEFRPTVYPGHVLSIAGDYLFALDERGACMVLKTGKDLEWVGVNQLGPHKFGKYPRHYVFNRGAQPFFSGNRIFIRSDTHLYSIGDPKAAMRLSKRHQFRAATKDARVRPEAPGPVRTGRSCSACRRDIG